MFTMTMGCGALSYFVDNKLMGDIESRMKYIVKLDPPATIVVAGHSTLKRVSMGTLTVRVTDAQGFLHDMLLPAMNVPGLRRHLFSGGTAVLKGVNTVIAKESYLGVGHFKISLRKDYECPTKYYLDLELTPRGNYQTKAAFPTRVISGHTMPTRSALASRLFRSRVQGAVVPLETAVRPFIATFAAAPDFPVLQTTASDHSVRLISGGPMGAALTFTVIATHTITPGLATATTAATPAMLTIAMAVAGNELLALAPETSEREHQEPTPRCSNERTMQAAWNIAETGVNFTESLTACDIYKINNGTEQKIRNKPGKIEIIERLQLVSPNLLDLVTPGARGNCRFMTKCPDHYTKFKAVYFFSAKYKVLTTLVKFVQDFVMPLGLLLRHMRADGGGEFIASYYRDCCRTTAIIQLFNSPNTLEYNSLREWDGHVIMDVAQYMLNGAALPKYLWGKMVATVVFLLNRLPSKTIGGDTSYYRMLNRHVDLFFLQATGTRPHGGRQAHLMLTSQHARSPHQLQSKQQLRAHWLQ